MRVAIAIPDRNELGVERRAADFVKLATALARGRGNAADAAARAAANGSPREVVDVLKAAGAGAVFDADLAPYQPLASAFLASLNHSGAFDALRSDMQPAPLHSRFGLLVNVAAGSDTEIGHAAPVSQLGFAAGSLDIMKVAAISVLSEELLNFSAAEGVIGNSLRAATAYATDSVFVGDLIASATSITATGLDAAGAAYDMRRLLDLIHTGNASRLHVVMGPTTAKRVATLTTSTGALAHPGMSPTGGTFMGMPAHVSDHALTNVFAVDASGYVGGADDVELKASRHADVLMNTEPNMAIATGSPPTTATAAQLTSMFQTNSVALMALRRFGFQKIRADAAAKLTGVAWGGVGSPPA